MTGSSVDTAELLERARALEPGLLALRREIHAHPEMGLHLPATQARILQALDGLDVEIHLGRGLTSVVAVLRGEAPEAHDGAAPVVLLRADMDALPVTEQVDSPWVSQEPGVMHACGHDLHVAGLVGAARILHSVRDRLHGDVVLMFQPGEEGPGGARPMLAEGLLEVAGRRVEAAYALHVFSADHPRGTWFGRPGPLMAASDELAVTVRGRGGHGSAPHRTLDPVPVACEMVLALEVMVTRRFNIFDPVVLTVGKISGGTKDNIIGDTATIEMTLRSFSVGARARLRELTGQVVAGVAAAHGMAADCHFVDGYPVTVNDPVEYALAQGVAVELFGEARWADMPEPEAGSEDMGFVLAEVPGAYLNLSACPSSDPAVVATSPDNHSPRAEFDDSVVVDGALWYAAVALRRCAARRAGGGVLTGRACR